MQIFMTGASGLVGKHLCEALYARGDTVVALTRKPKESKNGVRWVVGDAAHPEAWQDNLSGSDAVINLAGESVMGRWTDDTRQAIEQSRVKTTQALVTALKRAATPPPVFVSASAVGYYGTDSERLFNETSPAGAGFLAHVAKVWEAATDGAEQAGTRTVMLRLGVVLAADGGAWPTLARPIKLGVGGTLGDGAAWMPWVHIDDVVGMFLWALDNGAVRGPVNVVAPGAARSREVMKETARALHRPLWLRVPALLVRLGAGQMAEEMLLAGQHVEPAQAQTLGYTFRFPRLPEALQNITHSA